MIRGIRLDEDMLRVTAAEPPILPEDREVERHFGPGPHPGTGTDQDVHGGDGKRFGRSDRYVSQNALIESFAKKYADHPNEVAYVYRLDQEDYLKIFEGDEDSVDFNMPANERQGLAIVHNHPTGATLSRQDLITALKTDMTESHVATVRDGEIVVYSFIFSRDMRDVTRAQMETRMWDASREAYNRLESEIGKEADSELWHRHNDYMWKELARDFSDVFEYHKTVIGDA